ncbi:MAG: TspO/MBR family protein [Flavobacteriaceae bacterium]
MENIIESLSWIDTIASTIWIVLSLIMFWILYKVYETLGSTHPTFYFGIFLLILVWLYPIYTFFFNQLEVGFVGNVLTLLLTVIYMKRLRPVSVLVSRLMIPQIVWLIVATFYVGCMLVLKYQNA